MLKPIATLCLPMVVLAASAFALSACERQQEAMAPEPQSPPVAAVSPTPPQPPQPVVDRAALLEAMSVAASAYAAGQEPAGEGLAGRRFVVRQVFGCGGPAPPRAADAPGDGVGRWSWSQDRKAVQIDLAPADWSGSALIEGGDQSWEAAEGFWLLRPWQLSGGCPAVTADPLASEPARPSPQSAGIAAVFDESSSRLGRRNGRAYTTALRGEDGAPPATTGGYRLVLEGRFTAFASGRAVRCRAASPDQRPVCIAAARVDRVAFEDASGAVLSEWRAG
ncbi:hypothetical protein [Caulobacter sp. NIBR2454]|uniref:hypothetical protein n=1 Tax=Caulobacter sp. NIBR2454 TaxID=3015996 RepID=UPI0022B5FD4A|nr:hypothetical protein [Caulobacter sp. NIBR2454]